MQDAIQTTAGSVGFAAQSLIEFGIIGALLVLSLALNMLLGWLLWRTRERQIDHLEAHYDSQN